jgi:hypothetical protein
MNVAAYLGCLLLGSSIGFLICAIFSIAKIAELEHTAASLRDYIKYITEEKEEEKGK